MGKVLESAARVYAREALGRASLRAELLLSIVRTVFCVLIAIRFVTLNAGLESADTFWRGVVMLPPTVLAGVFSLVLVRRLRKGSVSAGFLTASVIADAVVCTVAIGSNVLWPFPGYRGILLIPETATFLALVFAAGFRASYRLATIGAAANGVGLSLLVVLDHGLQPSTPSPGVNIISLYVVLFGATAALSIWGARRTERLVEEAAVHSYKTTRAEQGLSTLLEGHHDAMSLLSAALFGIERLKTSRGGEGEVASLAQDLEMLRHAVGQIKEQALREVLVLRPPTSVSLKTALGEPRATFDRMVSPIEIEWRLADDADEVVVAGGALALQRLLVNLLVNAKDGDGQRGATHVRVRAAREDAEVVIEVEDDGPGFVANVLDSLPAEGQSSKASGTATGLRFVRAVAEASGGRLQAENTDRGGRVTVVLPATVSD